MIGRRFLLACSLVVAPVLLGQNISATDDGPPPPREFKVFANAGTIDRIARFASDGTTVVDSNIYQVGGLIGINTSATWRMLTIDNGANAVDGIRLKRGSESYAPYFDLLLSTSGTTPYVSMQVGDNNAWRPLALQPNGGRVGIGITAPATNLHINSTATTDAVLGMGPDPAVGPALNIGYGGSSYGRGIGFINVRDVSPTNPHPSLQLRTADVIRMWLDGTGRVGVGPSAPTERFEVTGGSIYLNSEDSGVIIDAGGLKRYGLVKNLGRGTELRYLSTVAFKIRRITAGGDVRSGTASSDVPMTFTAAGNVGIGIETPNDAYKLHVGGNAHFTGAVTADGALAAKYQDVAEWVPSRDDLAPGTVVVLDAMRGNAVIASTSPYDTTVAGVVSAQPGLILGVGGADKEQIATTGRVRVKVDASAAPIRVGDLLVTSSKPGFAMRSIPVDIAGTSLHRPGTIVGKALESLNGGEGEILVLLSLQ
jgi:hypothetical protein